MLTTLPASWIYESADENKHFYIGVALQGRNRVKIRSLLSVTSWYWWASFICNNKNLTSSLYLQSKLFFTSLGSQKTSRNKSTIESSPYIYFGTNVTFLSLTVSSYFNITHILVYFPKQHYFSLKTYHTHYMFVVDFLYCHITLCFICATCQKLFLTWGSS